MTEEHSEDMLECERSKADALEGIKASLEALQSVKPPVVNVAAPGPAINVSPAVNVAAPLKPKGCTIITTRSDGSKSTSKVTFDY